MSIIAPKSQFIKIDGATYDVTNFDHPGGSIIGYAGANGDDAGNTFREFHARSRVARRYLASLPRRNERDVDVVVENEIEKDEIQQDYLNMRAKLVDLGCFEPDPIHVYFRLMEIAFFFGLGVWLAPHNIYASMFAFLMFKTRCGWVQHEGGHLSLTGNKAVDRRIQIVTMGLAGGLSGTFWNTMHHKHHATPQKIKHDIDLDTTPAVAFFKTAFEENTNGRPASRYMNRWWMRFQSWLFLPVANGIMVHGFWTYYLHPKRVISAIRSAPTAQKKWTHVVEATCMLSCHIVLPGIFYARGGYSPLAAYALLVLCNFWNVIYLFGHFSLSHTFTDVVPETANLRWYEYAIGHSVNISTNSALVTWIMGYLNFQIEHHLFPSMPQYKNALASRHVREFCAKWDGFGATNNSALKLKYREYGYWDAWRKMFTNLSDVGQHYFENGISHSKKNNVTRCIDVTKNK